MTIVSGAGAGRLPPRGYARDLEGCTGPPAARPIRRSLALERPAVAPDIPAHFGEADRERLSRLPPVARGWLLDKHKEMLGAHTQRSQALGDVGKVVEKWAPQISEAGAKPGQAIDVLMQSEQRLRNGTPEEKAGELARIAQAYGIDPGATPDLDPGDQEAVQIGRQLREGTPEQRAQILQALVQHYQNAPPGQPPPQQGPSPEEAAQVQAAVRQFVDAVDQNGNLLHPHFAELQPVMARYAEMDRQHGIKPEISSLYERAPTPRWPM